MEMDVLTLLAWMEFDQLKADADYEKEQSRALVDHVSRKLSAQLTMINDKNQKEITDSLTEFEKSLKPDKKTKGKKDTKQVAKSFEWPSENQFEQLLKMQEQGGAY